jgi:sugar lactone lactonase YvrE
MQRLHHAFCSGRLALSALPYRAAVAIAALVVVAAFAPLRAEPQYISSIAGSGVAGFNGDGLDAAVTALYLPQDGTYGPDGNFYFLDWNNHRVRRLVTSTNLIEGVVATGELGDAQDGPALAIRLNHPTGLFFDAQGRMLMACWHNSKVKRLDFTTGMVTNVAGTGARSFGGDGFAANDAFLDLPSSAVEDSLGNIIISDQANFRLRRCDPIGNISTICGTGIAGYGGDGGQASLAMLRSPVGQSAPPAGRIDIDAQDRIYIADTGNHVIRRIDSDGTIRTVAGSGGQAGYSGDGGPATSARLNTPSDVAVAPDGTMYIADTANNAVRRVALDGTIVTIAGTGAAGFSGDGGLGRSAKLNRPYGVAIGPSGEVVIADSYNHRFRVLTEERREGTPTEEDPEIEIVACTGEIGSICTYAGTGFAGFNGDGKDRQKTHLYWPFDVEFTPSGRVYVIDWNNHRIREVLPDQRLLTVMGTPFVGDGPADLSDQTAPGAPGLSVDLNHPTDLQEFPSGELLVVNWHNHKVRQLDPDTGLVQILMGGPAGFAGDGLTAREILVNQPPHGVFDAAGNFFLIDQRNQRLRLLKSFATLKRDAPVSTIAGTGTRGFNGDGPALMTQVNFPTGTNPEPSGGIAVAANGAVYFADTLNHRIRRLVFNGPDFTDGEVTTIAGTGERGGSGDGGPAVDAQINYPQDLEIGPDGKLYFADTDNHRVRRIDLSTGMMEAVAGTGVEGYSGDGGPALTATFRRPFGVAFDPFGNLYIADTFNGRIRKVKMTAVAEGPESLLPADYLASYVEVRDCRFSLEHGGITIRVLASPGAAEAYQDEAETLPVGSIIVKEEYSDSDCSPSSLLRWRVMRKEAPGFDPEHGDWHWQFVTPRREVVYDDKATCISCHLAPDCTRRDYMCTLEGGGAEMEPVLDSLPATLLSISGTPPSDDDHDDEGGDGGGAHGPSADFDIYAVGADPGDGRGPLVLHYGDGDWQRLSTGATGDLWWISDHMIEGDFYLCGEGGLILRLTHETKEFERMGTPGNNLLFGIWGTDRQNLWAVGGDPADEDRGGVVWRFNGTTWTVDDTVEAARPEGIPTLYKVWGRNPSDIYAVGRLGVALHFNGTRWTRVSTGVTRPLFTVHGNASRVVATGGAFEGVLLELEGAAFVDHTPSGAPQLNGVFVSEGTTPAGPAAAVGAEGSFATWGEAGWELKPPVVAARALDFHATWVDSSSGVWAVGGDLSVDQSYGVLAYAGSSTIGRHFVSDPCPLGEVGKPGTVSYTQDIAPLFEKKGCTASVCHGGLLPASEYDMRRYDDLFGPGLEAQAFFMCNIVPGNPEASFLIEKLRPNPRSGVRMPNGLTPLSEEEIALISTWILEGAALDTPEPRPFRRGDADGDGRWNITDAVFTFNFLFNGGPVPPCRDAADSDDFEGINLTDGIFTLNFLFLGGRRIPAPYPSCGEDPTPNDGVTCDASPCT